MRRLAAAIACLLVAGCSPSPSELDVGAKPPPVDHSPASTWMYAAYLLGRGDAAQARMYLDSIVSAGLGGISDPPLFFRDLAEACLFSGDSACVERTVGQARDALGQKPTTAQFREPDRHVFEQSLDALQAAAGGDTRQLQQLTLTDQPSPSADAWYLLGWVEEQHGDLADAQSAYRAYLQRAPQWSFLREAGVMRLHAQNVG